MKTCFSFLAVLLMLSNTVLAQMQLKLSSDFEQQNLSQALKSNSQLIQPNSVISPPDVMELKKGLIMLGLLADLSIPMGSDSGFKHIAGTGFSGHVVLSYLLSPEVMLALRAGYIKYGTQSEEGSELGYSYKYEDSYSQIPILLGAYYMFGTKGAFKPYIGLALGLFLQNYNVKWTEDFGGTYPAYNLDETFSASSFGVVPAVGFYFLLGSMTLQAAAEYNYLFSGIPVAEDNYNVDGLYKSNSVAATTATTDPDHKASSISFLVGVSFPIGGK